jgi:hypothetical protein
MPPGVVARAAPRTKPTRLTIGDMNGSFAPGEACAFQVDLATLANDEKVTDWFDRDGSLVKEVITDTLKIRISNPATGIVLELNASGPGMMVNEPDGTSSFKATGDGFCAYPSGLVWAGLWSTHGPVLIRWDAAGHLVERSLPANVTDLCAILAG